ncbi:MAG: accessory gene regulator B family protein [Lachnospiraceae bacterium]|nr:accessory gene regulator B family protein [Lachnospiraceae bacterium]
MIEKLTNELVSQMTEAKLINEELEEYYAYVLISWIEKFITVGTIILISVAVHKLLPTMFFLLFFFALRKRTGGYHLNKFYQCYLATVASYISILGMSSVLANYPILLFAMLLWAIGIIEIIGTVNHPNMHMDSEELAELKASARIITLLEGVAICCFTILEADMVFISYMAIAVILCAALLCIAKITKQEVKVHEESQ